MGLSCSSTSSLILSPDYYDTNTNKLNSLTPENNYPALSFTSYLEYTQTLPKIAELISSYIDDIIYKNHFTLVKPLNQINSSLYENDEFILSKDKLFEASMEIYQKINIVYNDTESRNKIRNELNKITFNLISKYIFIVYKSNNINDSNQDSENDIDDISIISDYIIKRINFFIEEFPFTLYKLISIIRSKKIYVFAYDKSYHINFYISTHKSSTITHFDYITYIFFINECILPLLISKLHFNQSINLIINFNHDEIDTELICFLLSYLDRMYPMIINLIHIVNYDIESLKRNKVFIEDIEYYDSLKVLMFHNDNYKKNLIKNINPNCLPLEYGGYHSMYNYYKDIDQAKSISDYLLLTIKNILVNSI